MLAGTNNKIAFAHLTSRLKQVLVAVLSVTFGISMYIFMNGFVSGVNDIQTELAFSTLAHIRVYNDLPNDNSNLLAQTTGENTVVNIRNSKIIQYTEGIRNSDLIVNTLKDYPQIVAVSSQVNINVFFRSGSIKLSGLLSGVDAINEDKLFNTSNYMSEGNWEDLNFRSDGAIIGIGLANKLSLKLNDNLVVNTADGIIKSFKIIGIFKTTLAGVDNSKAYIKISAARQLLSKNQSYATDVQANIQDFNTARIVAENIAPYISYKVDAWEIANGQLEAANELRKILAVAVSLTILIVAGFGIYNIMNMTVNEKIKEIAILKAMGFSGGDIVHIFLTQSLIIGFIGGIFGIVLGYAISIAVNNVPFNIATLKTLPMSYNVKDYFLAFIFGMITTFIAGYLPAKKASSIDPVSIIRG